jgi:NitT/TauT family transport system substrate-binding protein
MKTTATKILALALALLMLFAFVGCAKDDTREDNTPAPDNTKPLDTELEMKIYALNGTTALGMAKMIEDSKNNTDTMNYNISLHTSADAITGSIVTGECAIAALPTNVAVKLFNKSQGKLQLLAINTLGVLYVLEDGTQNINSLEDLRGKTIYLPGAGSNPEYITAALLSSAGLTVGTDVFLDTTTYNSPDALQQAMIQGKAPIAVLPEPKVSATTSAKPTIKVALDLTKEWEDINGKNTLVQGCLVVNTAFAKQHPQEIAKFLEDYKTSVETIQKGDQTAIDLIVNAGILPKAAIAQKALPKCNICFVAGNDMKPIMNTFCEKIFAYDKTSIGGALPTDAFYYVGA